MRSAVQLVNAATAMIVRASVYAFRWASDASRAIRRAEERLPTRIARTSRLSPRRFAAGAARTGAGASRPGSSSASRRKAAGRTARAAKTGAHRNHPPRKFTINGMDANTRTVRRSAIVFWYRSPCMPSPLDVSCRRLDRTYSVAIRAMGVEAPILSPIPPLRPRLYIAITIESRGEFHRARRGSHRRPGGPRRDAPGPHDSRAHPRSNPRAVRGGQDHVDRQRLRLRVPPDDPVVRARGHGRP